MCAVLLKEIKTYKKGFPCGSAGKESSWNEGRPGFDP